MKTINNKNLNIDQKILKVIDQDIKPIINSHGGDLSIKSFDNGILTISLLGACKNCLSAQFTSEDLIKNTLVEKFPEIIKDVRIYNDVDNDMWDFAKKILRKDG